MKLSNNVLRLALLIAVTLMTLVVVLFDADKGAQDAVTHMAALILGGLIHSLGGDNNDNG